MNHDHVIGVLTVVGTGLLSVSDSVASAFGMISLLLAATLFVVVARQERRITHLENRVMVTSDNNDERVSE